MNKRSVIIHYHVFKNAGSTVDAILNAKFGSTHGFLEGPVPYGIVATDELERFVAERPALRAVSSHQARLPVPEIDDTAFFPIVFLRHPIDRVGSVYLFEHNQILDNPTPGSSMAKNGNIRDYVRWRLDPTSSAVIRNFQTIHLAGRHHDMRGAIASESDLDIAKERLMALPFFGLVDRADASFASMSDYLAPAFGSMAAPRHIHNRSMGRPASLDGRIAEIREQLGSDLYTQLIEMNELDWKLYQFAGNLWDRRYGS